MSDTLWRKSLRFPAALPKNNENANIHRLKAAATAANNNNDSEVFSKPNNNQGRRLSVVEEDRSSTSDNTPAPQQPAPPPKQRKFSQDNNRLLPSPIPVNNLEIKESKEELVSPIPLPPGVECIDPPNDSFFENAAVCYRYMKAREKSWVVTPEILFGESKTLAKNRSLLVDWIISVIHHLKMSQETLYHTISLLDRTLAVREVTSKHLQLVGITAIFIASKLEEYYHADLLELVKLTQNSYTESAILKMEKTLLHLHSFTAYGTEPMIFINRFIRAAGRQDDEIFHEIVILLFDAVIAARDYSSILTSKVAASAVCGALSLYEPSSYSWNLTMMYYTEYTEDVLRSLVIKMLQTLLKIKVAAEPNDFHYGVRKKYSSVSLHKSILSSDYCSESNINKAIHLFNNNFH